MSSVVDSILGDIRDVLSRYDELRAKSQNDSLTDQPGAAVAELLAQVCAMIQRLAPPGSAYDLSLKEGIKTHGWLSTYNLGRFVGVLRALEIAYARNYLTTVGELLRAELFSDFVEMAQHLLSEGYKDPAAVILGSVLEEHLRQLSIKSGISIAQDGRPKRADSMNASLAAQKIYSKLDQKSVTAWLDLRNRAAHGRYHEYNSDQVELALRGVVDFLARNPA